MYHCSTTPCVNDDVQRDFFGFQLFQSLLLLYCFLMFKKILLAFSHFKVYYYFTAS